MKKLFLNFGTALLLLVTLLWSPSVVLAAPAAPPVAAPATPAISAGPASKSTTTSNKFGPSIPDTFDVNQLQAKDQKSYVPTAKTSAADLASHSGVIALLVNVISLFVKVISSISLIVFIIGALLVITSQGKEDVLEKGKNAMLYSVIGIIVALMSFIIVTFVRSVLY